MLVAAVEAQAPGAPLSHHPGATPDSDAVSPSRSAFARRDGRLYPGGHHCVPAAGALCAQVLHEHLTTPLSTGRHLSCSGHWPRQDARAGVPLVGRILLLSLLVVACLCSASCATLLKTPPPTAAPALAGPSSAPAVAAPVVAWAGLRGRLETGRWKAAVRCKS